MSSAQRLAPTLGGVATDNGTEPQHQAPRLKLKDIPSPSQIAGDPVKAAGACAQLLDGAAWLRIVQPLMDEIDLERDRAGRRGPKTLFTSRELESVFLFGWLAGQPAAKDARITLELSPQARTVLHFDQPRGGQRGGGAISSGLPSEPSLSRHRRRVGDERRLKIYERLVREHVA
jgi:hypothetical protein